jgi:membrane-associated phospholipid phosphatase
MTRAMFYSGFAISLLCLLLLVDIGSDWTDSNWDFLERSLAAPVHSLRGPYLDNAMVLLTKLGGTKFLATIVVLSLLSQHLCKRDKCAFVILATGQGLFSNFLKSWFLRPRPGLDYSPLMSEPNFSFPSGHSMGSLCIYGFLAYLLIRKQPHLTGPVLLAATLLVGLVGLTRIYIAVHFPADVVGGFAAGWPCLFVAMLIHHRTAPAGPKLAESDFVEQEGATATAP